MYNDPALGIYVILIRMINKYTHFLQLQIYTKQIMRFIIIIIIIIIITKNTIYFHTYTF